jgi:serine/threonine-protein kinase RsbW
MPTLRIDATSENLAAVRRFVREAAADAGAAGDAMDDLVQAVDEAVTNVVVHGYGSAGGSVDVEVRRRGDELVVRVVDDAPAFDPTAVPEPDLSSPLRQRRLGGMGVHLVRGLCDEVRYRRDVGGRNELTLIKRTSTKVEEEPWISR